MTKKVKIDVVDFTIQDAGLLVGELALQEIQADQLTAKMNTELDAVRAKYEEKFTNLRGNINIRREALEQWAAAHKDLFKDPRSMEFERGTIGFRTGMPKLKLKSKNTWEKVLEAVKDKSIFQWYRVKEEVDKEAIIAGRNVEGALPVIDELGIKIVQDDAFFCEVKKDEQIELPESGKAA